MRAVRLVFPHGGPLGWRPFGHAPSRKWLAVLALVAASALLGAVTRSVWELQRDTRIAQGAATTLRSAAQARRQPASAQKPALTAQQAREWNQVARHLNLPWPALLDALEAATPEDVAVVAIEPDPARASVRLQVEAKALDTLLAYAGALKSAGPFEEVVLLRHETNEQDGTRPLRLGIDVRLKAKAAMTAMPDRAEGAR